MAKLVSGDVVTINISDDNWEWGYKPFEQQKGTKAVFLEYSEVIYGRINNFGKKPGIYENVCWSKVKVGEKIEIISSHFIEGATTFNIEGDFLRELPETPFWEGDSVSYYDKAMRVTNIRYDIFNFKYTITDDSVYGLEVDVSEHELRLTERGKVWKYYHKEPIEFKNLEEEAIFYKIIGLTEEVRNPYNDIYLWTLEEVLKAIENNIVDAFFMSSGSICTNSRICAIKFHDIEFGDKIRKHYANFGKV